MGGNLSAVLAVVALVAALAAAVWAVLRLRGPAGHRHRHAAGHLRGAAHRRAGRRAAAHRAHPASRGEGRPAPAGAGRRRPGWRSPTPTRCSPSTGAGGHHGDQLAAAARRVAATGRSAVLRRAGPALRPGGLPGPRGGGGAAARPDGRAAPGALVAVADGRPRPGWCRPPWRPPAGSATQLALAELDSSRARLARAEVRALRAQISPHFIYNALTAIASFVRTDPERARELILEFAEFTRYSFRAHGEFTTLAEELRSIDRYLTIERARFGDRLQVRLQIAPEVLPVALPFLCLQPLVENAVRHGLSRKPGVGTVSIVARDAGRRVPHHCRGRRRRDGPGRAADRRRPADGDRPTTGPARRPVQRRRAAAVGRSATSSAWWSRPRRARARR